MYAEIQAAIASTRFLGDIITASKDLRNFNELAAAVSEVNTKLMQATAVALASQEKQAALAERVRELENQITEVENWKTQLQRYTLFEFPTKALAYALKPGMEHGEPMHYLCTSCVDKKQKSTLQPNARSLHCPVCKTNIDVQSAPHFSNRGRGSAMSA
jgi:hypothetical protein